MIVNTAKRLRTTQNKIERLMLRIRLGDYTRSEEIGCRTKVDDIVMILRNSWKDLGNKSNKTKPSENALLCTVVRF